MPRTLQLYYLFKKERAVLGGRAQIFVDAEQLVVFADAVGAAGCAGLDLAGARCNCQIGDCRIFGFAAAMAHNGRPAGTASHINGFEGFGERADLVELDQNRICAAELDALCQPLSIGYEQIVADELNLVADFLCQRGPAVPVIFGKAVFEAHDWIFRCPFCPVVDHVIRADLVLGVGFEE